ncbi:hypothetical protein [Serratia microhaemolytica]|uniref:hypothetical protein n=1 Tax=Serratia microhaemolytica TaxID=2675110 RepID=UPI000FDF4470|nr:hypothetical protein [Serratia microhaemolytica]
MNLPDSDITQITQVGLCCPIGYSALAAAAAFRAGMDHFSETRFIDRAGKPVIGSQLYGVDLWGPARLSWMLTHALQECLTQSKLPRAAITLILLLPEANRPGLPFGWQQQVAAPLLTEFADNSVSLAVGKAGIGPALQKAQHLLHADPRRTVLLAATDSYFTPQAINHYLSSDRLLTPNNPDGFIPGEGAAAILLQQRPASEPGLQLLGIGLAEEEAHILQTEKKQKARGLTQAIRAAIAQAGHPLSNTDFHISDVNGEAFYSREAALAITRCLDKRIPDYHHWLLSTKLGETGAASGPLILALLYHLMPLPLTIPSYERGMARLLRYDLRY